MLTPTSLHVHVHSHTRILGNTVELIAWEKGGIFARDKADKINVSSKQVELEEDSRMPNPKSVDAQKAFLLDSNTPGVIAMFRSCARVEGCGQVDLQLVDATGARLLEALDGGSLLGLAGKHQYGNATLAAHLCQEVLLSDSTTNNIPTTIFENKKTIQGIQSAQWPGRCQVLEQEDSWTYLLDGAHTYDSMTATVDFFSEHSLSNIKQDDNEEPSVLFLVFNCSHERNPVELLRLLLPLKISKVYFGRSDSSRPSPVAVPTAKSLLEDQGIPIQTDLLEENIEKPTWQETLAALWKHLTADGESSTTSINCNSNAKMILEDLHENHKPSKVLVTGSLYLVGSFLTALEWTEESSPDITSA